MLRITLGGEEFTDFPTDQESGYVKLIFPQAGGGRPVMRTYTIRQQNQESIDVDFALHDAQGPASSWAVNAKIGDSILIGGPGPKRLVTQDADWFVICGDMTALPAISVNLALLPADAQGYAIIEVVDEADIQPLIHPENMQLLWVINKPNFHSGESPLLEKLQQIKPMNGRLSVWVACEFSVMKAIRKHLKSTYELPKSHFYTSSYWKFGLSEDQHKIVKKQDTDKTLNL